MNRSRAHIPRIGIEGALMTLSPLPLVLPKMGLDTFIGKWQFALVVLAATACFAGAVTLFRRPPFGKSLGVVAVVACFAAEAPYIIHNPFIALAASVLLISAIFGLVDFQIQFDKKVANSSIDRGLQRARWGAAMVPVTLAVGLTMSPSGFPGTHVAITLSWLVSLVLYLHYALKMHAIPRLFLALPSLFVACYILVNPWRNYFAAAALIVFLVVVLSFPRKKSRFRDRAYWWDILLNHPARILLTTFSGLCLLGTLLLALPVSVTDGAINLVDAAFTSVSAVCVTGLIVVDTPAKFTLFGQASILLLIQLGGLGIMSITTVVLHVMGRRLSLKQERVLTSMTDTDHKDLIHSLVLILKFTFLVEGLGAILLALFFFLAGDNPINAVWQGLFTAVSAFCNAGFALQSDSLISYQSNTPVIMIVSALIIFGGMAPATSLLLPKWLSGKITPIPARIALVTTVILLGSGTFFIMAFEWNGALAGLSFIDKVQNAWFQSVTLRTAGFNSVDLTNISNPTFLMMLLFMFIGGCPGGTAGGIKTTTIGIIAMTFWSVVTNKDNVIVQNRLIHSRTIFQAITIIASSMVVWFIVTLMLEATQQISARDLIFEVTSAIATVGLSIGATAGLDEIGKVIVIIAMFAGRIGPMTLFMLFSSEQQISISRCPVEKISLT